MPGHRIEARPARRESSGLSDRMALRDDPDVLSAFLEDAAHFPGGHARAIATPASEAEVVEVLRGATRVLTIGAQSSLTGGATPMGDTLLSTSKLNRVLSIGRDTVQVEAGVTLADSTRRLPANTGTTRPCRRSWGHLSVARCRPMRLAPPRFGTVRRATGCER